MTSITGGTAPPAPPQLRSGGRFGGGPGDLFLIGDPAGQAAVQDADQPVSQGPERLAWVAPRARWAS